jgi:hypothetical protein
METNAYNQKLNRYVLNDQIVYTGFSSFNDAEECAHKKGGTLVEVVFRDGNDNPEITDEAGLIEKKLHYYVYAGDEYKFIHSSDPGFRKYADELENTEDPIIVIKNDHFESVTSRERSKYLKHACVYELGISLPKS